MTAATNSEKEDENQVFDDCQQSILTDRTCRGQKILFFSTSWTCNRMANSISHVPHDNIPR